jgi:4-carboxymuconolactone decarboxylase
MRPLVIGLLLVSVSVVLARQPRELNLRGDRFPPLTSEQLAPAQKAMVDDLLAGPRTSLNGPFNVLLRSPEMGNLAQNLGEYVRFRTTVPARLNELAILMTARWWVSQYVWSAHQPIALAAGLRGDVVDDLRAGERPRGMRPDEQVVFAFTAELREQRRVSDRTFQAARDLLGEQGVVDLMATLAYYDLVSMVVNVDRYPMAEGQLPPFPEP